MLGGPKRGAVPFVVLAIVLWACSVASAAAPRVPVAQTPRLPTGARLAGPLPAARSVELVVSLASRDPLGLQTLATAVSTPGTPEYRHYLSVGQFADRFGAPRADVRAVADSLRRAGLTVAPVDRNRLSLTVSGSAHAVARAFATRLDRVRLAGGRIAFAERRTPTLPAPVAADVDGVVGLDSLIRPTSGARPATTSTPLAPAHADATGHASGHVATGGPQPCAAATAALAALSAGGEGGGYTADVIQAAYGFPGLYAQGDTGAGQTVALYELQPLKTSDVAAYQSCYGTHAKVQVRPVGMVSHRGSDAEAALDVEQVVSLAPGARVLVYQAGDSAADGLAEYSRIVSQDAAKTISTSWGACEASATADHSFLGLVRGEQRFFEEAAVQGQSILAASGDSGSSGCYAPGHPVTSLAVQDPSSQPFATAVGGTALYGASGTLWDPAVPGSGPEQSVWNTGIDPMTNQPGATGGGLSTLWRMPAYQSHAAPGLGVVNANSSGSPCHSARCREVPDVSADGDPGSGYLIYARAPGQSTPQWGVVGGTSAAAPLWAAVTALADALPACRGASLGFENPALYSLAAQPGNLTDIAAADPGTGLADNDALGRNAGKFPVTTGYDMTTGLGTPSAATLAANLCALRAPVYAVSVASPGHHEAIAGARVTLRARGSDSGRLALSYSAKGLPKGLSISKRGVISGRTTRLGRYRVRITAVDHATNRATISYRLEIVGAPPRLGSVALRDVAARRPRLSFTVTRRRYAPAVRRIRIALPRGLSFGRHGRGVRVTAGGHRARFGYTRSHGEATITLRRAQTHVGVTIGRGTLFADKAISRTARRAHPGRVTVTVRATDARRHESRLAVRLRLRR